MVKVYHHFWLAKDKYCDAELQVEFVEHVPEGWTISTGRKKVFYDKPKFNLVPAEDKNKFLIRDSQEPITHCPKCGEKIYWAHCAFALPTQDRPWDDVAQPVQNNPGNFAPAHGIGKGRIVDERLPKVKANRQKSR